MNTQPMATAGQQRLSTWDPDERDVTAAPAAGGRGGRGGDDAAGWRARWSRRRSRWVRCGRRRRRRRDAPARRRLVPVNPDDMLLSGVLVGGQALAGRAQVVDAPVGQGHVVMFAIRPYWRWQTQGTFFLGFNAILNWNDLDAGRPGAAATRHRAVAVPPPCMMTVYAPRRGRHRCRWGTSSGARSLASWRHGGRPYRIFEGRTVGAGATQASAGILAPYIEGHDRGPLLDLTLRSLTMFDDFVARATEGSAIDVEYRRCGSLEIAADEATADTFRRATDAAGAEQQWLTAQRDQTARARAPRLDPRRDPDPAPTATSPCRR